MTLIVPKASSACFYISFCCFMAKCLPVLGLVQYPVLNVHCICHFLILFQEKEINRNWFKNVQPYQLLDEKLVPYMDFNKALHAENDNLRLK